MEKQPVPIAIVHKTKTAITWKAWGETNPGKARENNEDRILCEAERGIFVVADGMGGEAAGEVAAQHAVDAIKKRLHQETGTVARRLREAIAGANNEIYRLAERNPQWRGMACVLTAAVIEDGVLHIGHVGDSRLYVIQNCKIRKVTSDHSPVGQKEESGELSELEAMRHPRRNEVFRDIGSNLHMPDDADFIDYAQVPFSDDTAVILCSDGVSDMIASNEILQSLLENAGSPRDSVRRLIEKSNAAGGKDNISAIVVEANGFEAACSGQVRTEIGRKTSGDSWRSIWINLTSLLRGRWAFLCYGLLVGLMAAFLWQNFQKSGGDESIVPPSVPEPRVLRVEPASTAYPTIASALETARAGDRIEIGDGEYEESIRLKEGVDVTAHSPGRAILRLIRTPRGADAAIVAEGIQRAGLAGLAIKIEPGAGLAYGIRISNSSVNLSNLDVSGAVRAGILVDGSSAGTISASYVHGNLGSGIQVSGDAHPFLVGNVIYANGLSKSHKSPGMSVTDNSNPEVKRNVFSGNGAEAIRIQKRELKDRMTDNLFLGPGKQAAAVVVE